MAIKVNGTNITKVVCNGVEVMKVNVNGVKVYEKAASGETWVLNETLNDTGLSGNDNYYIGGSFISNSEKYIGLHRSYNTKTMECFLIYGNNTSGTVAKQVYEDLSTATWTNQAYRTITFNEPVTDTTLLAWLQANGTKQ